jgi:hypothetical protein
MELEVKKNKKRERFGRSVTLRDLANRKYQCELQIKQKLIRLIEDSIFNFLDWMGSYLFWGSLQMEQDVNKNKREIKIIVEQSINQEIFCTSKR